MQAPNQVCVGVECDEAGQVRQIMTDRRFFLAKTCTNAWRDLFSKISVHPYNAFPILVQRAKPLVVRVGARAAKGLCLALLLGCATQSKDKLRSYDDMAKAFLNDKLYAECLSVVESALKEDAHHLPSLNLKGICLLELEKYAEAEPLLLSVCDELNSPECWNNLAALYQRTHRATKCHEMAAKALAFNTYNSAEIALSNQALCFADEHKLAEAQQAADMAKKKAPQNCYVRLVSVKIELRRKALDEALREVSSTLSLCPADPAIHFWSAYATYKNGQKTDAYRKYRYIVDQFKRGEFVEASKSNLELLENRIPIPEPKL